MLVQYVPGRWWPSFIVSPRFKETENRSFCSTGLPPHSEKEPSFFFLRTNSFQYLWCRRDREMPLVATCLSVWWLHPCDHRRIWVTIGLNWERWIWLWEGGKKADEFVLISYAMPKSKCFQFLWDGLNDVLPFTWGTPQKSNWTYISWKPALKHEKTSFFAARADFRTIGVSCSP